MINYYRLLDLPDFSDFSEVKACYRKMAKTYHPDINKHEKAEEFFKVLTEGYNFLSNPIAKQDYDQKLKLAYTLEKLYKARQPKPAQKVVDYERLKELIRRKIQKEIWEYEKGLEKFPIKYRWLGAIVLIVWGLQLFYSNWFVNLLRYQMVFLILGALLFIMGTSWFVAIFFKWYRVLHLKGKTKMNYEKWSIVILLLLVFAGPSITLGLNQYRKSYHLENFSQMAVGKVVDVSGERVIFQFRHQDKLFRKSLYFDDQAIYNFREGWVMVKYSKADPRIAVLAIKTD